MADGKKMQLRKPGKKSMAIIGSSVCNLQCSYCFLHKTSAYAAEDKNIVTALKNGLFLSNISKSLDKMDVKKEDISNIQIWGAETSLHLDLFANLMPQILKEYKELNSIFFSTNMSSDDIDRYITFIDKIIECHERPFNISIQISMDGPDSILQRTRGTSFDLIHKNLLKLIDYYNNKYMGEVRLNFLYKTTISFEILEEICQSKETMIEYVRFFDTAVKDILYHMRHKNISWNYVDDMDSIPASPVRPGMWTSEDGIKVVSWARLWDTIDFESLGLKYGTLNLIYELFGSHDEIESIEHLQHNCGQSIMSLTFRWDGSLMPCTGTFMEDNENYLNEVKNTNPERYRMAKNTTKWMIPVLDMPEDELKRVLKLKEDFWKYENSFQVSILMAAMYEMSNIGQISQIYSKDFDLLYRHALKILPLVSCAQNNIEMHGDPFLPNLNAIRLMCNGLLSYFEDIERRRLYGFSPAKTRKQSVI